MDRAVAEAEPTKDQTAAQQEGRSGPQDPEVSVPPAAATDREVPAVPVQPAEADHTAGTREPTTGEEFSGFSAPVEAASKLEDEPQAPLREMGMLPAHEFGQAQTDTVYDY